MSANTRRSAVRVPCSFPVVVESKGKPVELLAEDVSRTGLRLRIARSRLALPSLPTLGQVAASLSRIFTEEAWAVLDPARLGAAVKRRLRVVRIVRPILPNEDLRVGCFLTAPLTPEDAARLGVPLPPQGDAMPDVVVDAPAPVADLRALVVPQGGTSYLPFEALPIEVDTHHVVLRVTEPLGLELGGQDMRARLLAFAEVYGGEVQLEVSRAGKSAWQGPARLQSAEQDPDGALRLSFLYGRPLAPTERAALLVA
jgi:hypothetical protein